MRRAILALLLAAGFQAFSVTGAVAQTSPQVIARAVGHVGGSPVLVDDQGASGPRSATLTTDGGRGSAAADFGVLKAYARYSSPGTGSYQYRWSRGEASFRDTLTITHPTLNGTSGQITVRYRFDANVTGSGERDPSDTYAGLYANAAWTVGVAGSEVVGRWTVYPDGETIMRVTDGGSGTPFNQTRTYTAYFVYGEPFTIFLRLTTEAYAFLNKATTMTADAEHTGTWGGLVAVRDGNGNTVTDYSVSATSGTNYAVPNSAFPGLITPTDLFSRKTHGEVGTFDVILPLTGTPGTEPRSGGAANDYTLVFRFANPLASVGSAAVTSGPGSVSSSAIGSDQREYVVNLTGVTNTKTVTVTLNNVTDTLGNGNSSVQGSMSVLIGDTNGDRTVNSGDAIQTKNRSGQDTSAANAVWDVNTDGAVNAGDAFIVRRNSGTSLGE